MKVDKHHSDAAILAELGHRLARRRIDMQMTQAQLAEQAGIAKRTLERIEAGHPAQTSSLIRIFRVLGLLQDLERLLPATGPGPMELLRQKGKTRRRASRPRKSATDDRPWTWDSDE